MADAILSPAFLANMALSEAVQRGAKVSGCFLHLKERIEDNFIPHRIFKFGPMDYIKARNLGYSDSKAWDTDFEADGLIFTIQVDEDLGSMHSEDARKIIGDKVSEVLFGLLALRAAG